MPNGIHRWSRCDDIMVLNLYFKAGRKQIQASNEEVIRLSEDIGTPAAAVSLKMANFQAMDPKRSGGLDQWSQQSKEVWDEFAHNERRLKAESYKCRRGITESIDVVADFSVHKNVDSLGQIIDVIKSDPKLSPENAETLAEIVKTYYQRLASR